MKQMFLSLVSQVLDMFVGVEQAVRSLFEDAKEAERAIIFTTG